MKVTSGRNTICPNTMCQQLTRTSRVENNTKQKQNKNKTTTWALSCDFASPTCILHFRCKVLLWTIQSLRVGHFGQHSPYMWVTLDSTVPTCGSFWTTQSLRVGHFGQHSPTCGSLWTTQSPVVVHFGQHSPYIGGHFRQHSPYIGGHFGQ